MQVFYNKYFNFSLIVILSYLAHFIILGENTYVLIHDNLDFNVLLPTLADSKHIFSNSYIFEQYMSLPRVSLGSGFNLILWLYVVFKPFTAYVINQFLIHFMAFIGMYLFLQSYIFKEIKFVNYSILVAMLYALLPFWPSGGLSIAGLPLITYSFLNFYLKKETKLDYFIIISFPFYSSFIFCEFFYIGFLFVFILYTIFIKKEKNIKFIFMFIIFVFLYILVDYRLYLAQFFDVNFISQRINRNIPHQDFITSLKTSIKFFLAGQYHTASEHILLLPFILFIAWKNIFSENKNKLLLYLFLLNILIAFWYGFWKYEGWIFLKERYNLLNEINFSRIHSLSPFIWYVLFAISIKEFYEKYNISLKLRSIIVSLLIIIQVIYLFYKSNFIQEYKTNHITYKQFYAQDLFNKIAKTINQPKNSYKVVSLGLHPAIARYNGFYTLDGYVTNYPLKYNLKFGKIIDKELQKDKNLYDGFYHWGNRCYLYSSEIGYNFVRTKKQTFPINIDLNISALKRLGGKYIFSSYFIKNAKDNNLTLLKTFESNQSVWKIYLYKVN